MFSFIFAINSVGIMLASQITGKLAGRIRESKLFVFGILTSFLGGIVLLGLILFHTSLYVILVPLFFVVSSVGIVNTSGFALAMEKQGKNAGSASALLGLLSFSLGAIAAPMVGIGGERTAIPMGIVIVCAGSAAVLSYLLLIFRKSKRQETSGL